LTHETQRNLVEWSLKDHAKSPNPTNLDIHYHLPSEGLWQAFVAPDSDRAIIYSRATEAELKTGSTEETKRQLIENTPASVDNFKSLLETPKLDAIPSPTLSPATPSQLMRKMRWANIGWFYHWGTKQYDFAKGKSPISDNIRNICRNAVTSVDWDEVYATDDLSEWGELGAEWKSWGETYGKHIVVYK
jgi:alkylated DNA repair protein alkB homolog 1